eukprot:CAMPEP_0172835208 /NCGR_PEP_ID=MMETSP1075-20121228/25588_1 /TAXON_ID=2916 /ORGANISM="Ceratium fusus, Strain PA161109" /LENGTH=38 /DNA_ID= /DNA_START= /DNA_END= /DNA_ORIENTATION=
MSCIVTSLQAGKISGSTDAGAPIYSAAAVAAAAAAAAA